MPIYRSKHGLMRHVACPIVPFSFQYLYLQLNEHLKPARAHTSETGNKIMALGVPTEGPPSRPTTQQAMLAYTSMI